MARTETPPPAWGRLSTVTPKRIGVRNTPTCVGKTPVGDVVWGEFKKHPHLRGEDEQVTLSQILALETPPPAWGRQYAGRCVAHCLGNTPTCVGKTDVTFCCHSRPRKHPHLRGEDNCSNIWSRVSLETPPPAWGRRTPSASEYAEGGNTPTCVGKTFRKHGHA